MTVHLVCRDGGPACRNLLISGKYSANLEEVDCRTCLKTLPKPCKTSGCDRWAVSFGKCAAHDARLSDYSGPIGHRNKQQSCPGCGNTQLGAIQVYPSAGGHVLYCRFCDWAEPRRGKPVRMPGGGVML